MLPENKFKRGYFEKSEQHGENSKGALLLNSLSDKQGFQIMNIIIPVRFEEKYGFSFPEFFGGILNSVKRCVVTVYLRKGKRWIGAGAVRFRPA